MIKQSVEPRRALGAVATALVIALVGLAIGAAPASAKPADPGHQRASSQHNQDKSQHQPGNERANGKSQKKATPAKTSTSPVNGIGLGLTGLTGALEAILGGNGQSLPKITVTLGTPSQAHQAKTQRASASTGAKGAESAQPTATSRSASPVGTTSTVSTRSSPGAQVDAAHDTREHSTETGTGTPNAGQVQVAPMRAPSHAATTTPPTSSDPAKTTQQLQAMGPAPALSAPSSAILIGVLLLFGIGVSAVVAGAGYRGRHGR